MYNSAGGAKNNMNYGIAIVVQNKPNVQLPGPRRPSNWDRAITDGFEDSWGWAQFICDNNLAHYDIFHRMPLLVCDMISHDYGRPVCLLAQ
ncbi:hypothetical protein TNCT_375061 [Trichonephila clavata]|uniref:Uncharacterized protein n=1 Tax=Trichonephila clavata TaxID=2740835 RepID=A0A8X6F9L2_TRICU|nr:hypothetical protein TNCT_375061 [Trichonephila clavata]